MSMYGKKPLQYCKVISLQLIKIKYFLKITFCPLGFETITGPEFLESVNYFEGFLGRSVLKNLPANAGDMGSDLIPGSGRSSGEGNGNPL